MSTLRNWLDKYFTPSIVEDEGVALPVRGSVDFVGSGVAVTDDEANDKTIVTITAGSGVAVQDEGVSTGATATTLNFNGAGVVASGAGGTKSIVIAGPPPFGTTFGTICEGDDSRLSNDRTCSGLRSATTVVSVSAATAPTTGQVLTATGASAATWQTPGGGVTVQEEGVSLATTGTTIDFVGASCTASGTGATKTITLTGLFGANPVRCNAIDWHDFASPAMLPIGAGAGTLSVELGKIGGNTTVKGALIVDGASTLSGAVACTSTMSCTVATATTAVVAGAAGATAGGIRLPGGTVTQMAFNASNYSAIATTNSSIAFGNTASTSSYLNGYDIQLNSSTSIFAASGANYLWYGTGTNLGLFASSISAGGGAKVLFVANATTEPTSNPTGGAIWWTFGGASKVRGSSGTVTTFGPAAPHCDRCGRDFVHERENVNYGDYVRVCITCDLESREADQAVMKDIAAALAQLGKHVDVSRLISVDSFAVRKLAA